MCRYTLRGGNFFMPNQNFDQNDQSLWVQSVGHDAANPNNQQPSQQGGGWTGQPPGSTQSDGQMGQGGLVGAPVGAVRQDVENQINGLIDHLAGQVPGGHTLAPEAKQAMAGILNGLQSQLESQAQSHLGSMGGQL